MMLHQVAGKLTVAEIRDSFPEKYSALEGGVQGSGVSEATSKFNYDNDTSNSGQAGTWGNFFKGNNLRPTSQEREFYVQIRDDILDQIIEHGVTTAQSKLFSYFLKLNRFGDRPVKFKVREILLATRLSKSAYYVAIAKFERMGWFSLTHADVEISNFCTPTKKSTKQDSQSTKQDSEKLEPLPAKVSETPQTLQTYSDLLHTLSEEQRESFKKFCLKKIQECSFKIASKQAWLNKHGAEYLEEFKETYSDALANPEVIPPKTTTPFDIPDIPQLKRMYRDGWKDAAIHFGLIDPDSPEEEIQEESEPVVSLEVTTKPIADTDNPQEPTSPTSLIGSRHRKFARGNTVVIAEAGNIHKGETGKVIFTSYGSQEDEYRIALNRESHSVREVTIKIPKPCRLTYLVSSCSSSKL